MQNLSEGLLKAVRKAAETAELESKLHTHMRILNKIEVLYQAFTMKSFADAIIIINKNRENQILGLQQKIKCLYRQMTILNLKISSQSFMISSEAYTLSETAVQNENSSMKYIKSGDLLESSSFNDD
ncbi:uncharacterized protein BDCG_01040 [Blastomyces dermatitidis ER-3]|uniref:Uncharacterized protein n=1 Tax=Ajellomyces dermatitidis (strain ER-3 / ATCC MYA-2586) TaxID=559297 RepID=A0ABP2ERZ7_AJEDR|nr:uncharacterized protein BDCG_01040 [Blastomyces dermatitidis ER-3]EEQ84235.1 hypothetical protein BDCG_01040 [Blastomyces dermatitidis ER-3]